MEEKEAYISRCIQLATNGRGNVSPNPMVGAVIVHKGRIIGEGFHAGYGGNHAEVNAIQSVRDPSLLKESTLYVSLEPCSHYGKTPPCAELIIRKQISHVVVATLDPFPQVAGRGVQMLRDANILVEVGVLEEEALALNEAFFYAQVNDRPFVTLKWAQSADGFMDDIRTSSEEQPRGFSTDETRRWVHKLRAESDAIMVGTRTYLLDHPSLSTRYWAGKSPVRVILDRESRISYELLIANASAPTLVYTEKEIEDREGVQYIRVAFDSDVLSNVLEDLRKRGVQSLLVEGGASLLQSFLKEHLWNRIRVETSPIRLLSGVQSPDMEPDALFLETEVGYGMNTISTYLPNNE